MTAGDDDERRRAELVTALGAVRSRIGAACAAVDRDPSTVTLVAVTKTRPVADVAALARIGVLDIGESRDQEAAAKVSAIAQLLAGQPNPRWHFVGRLQSRKCRSIASYATAVHSLDRLELVAKLADAVDPSTRAALDVFVQVSLDGDPDRGGAPVDRLGELADAVAARSELRLRGVMAVPPMRSDAEYEFARLAEIAQALRGNHPGAESISAGMSADLEAAVKHGSTHVRVGSALLGRRGPVFG